jgi:DNA-directed RNA polymerase I, II, and III subunit RPABC1
MIIVFPFDPETDKKNKLLAKEENLKPLIESLREGNVKDTRLEFFTEDDLVFNITRHELVPKHIPLTMVEESELLKK